MMVALLLYACSRGVYSLRRIARACEERLDFQAVTALNRPDFRTISEFRRRHLAALSKLIVQVLALCRRAGLPARDLLHIYRKRRPGQIRDVSWLAPVLTRLRDLGDYEAALLEGQDRGVPSRRGLRGW